MWGAKSVWVMGAHHPAESVTRMQMCESSHQGLMHHSHANTPDTESLSGVFPQTTMGGSRGLCCGACERGNSLLIEPTTAGLVPFGHRAASASNRVGCLGLSECLGLGEDAVTVLHRHGGH